MKSSWRLVTSVDTDGAESSGLGGIKKECMTPKEDNSYGCGEEKV